jgi:hypothetical protein
VETQTKWKHKWKTQMETKVKEAETTTEYKAEKLLPVRYSR